MRHRGCRQKSEPEYINLSSENCPCKTELRGTEDNFLFVALSSFRFYTSRVQQIITLYSARPVVAFALSRLVFGYYPSYFSFRRPHPLARIPNSTIGPHPPLSVSRRYIRAVPVLWSRELGILICDPP